MKKTTADNYLTAIATIIPNPAVIEIISCCLNLLAEMIDETMMKGCLEA